MKQSERECVTNDRDVSWPDDRLPKWLYRREANVCAVKMIWRDIRPLVSHLPHFDTLIRDCHTRCILHHAQQTTIAHKQRTSHEADAKEAHTDPYNHLKEAALPIHFPRYARRRTRFT